MAQQQRVGKTATRLTVDDGVVKVTYHRTCVVEIGARGGIILNHGGWKTITTKTRMNQASHEYGLGFEVYQSKGEWFVSYDGREIPFDVSPLILRYDGPESYHGKMIAEALQHVAEGDTCNCHACLE